MDTHMLHYPAKKMPSLKLSCAVFSSALHADVVSNVQMQCGTRMIR